MTGRDVARVERLLAALEANLEVAGDRRRLAARSLLAGICRGVGFTLGVSVVSALLVQVLRALVAQNIPLLGGFFAEVIRAVEARM